MNNMTKDLHTAVKISKEQIEQTLMRIVKKAEAAMQINGGEGYPLTYTTSEVNGIGSDYEELIRTVQEMNAYLRVLNTYGEKQI
jgi:dihydroorotase